MTCHVIRLVLVKVTFGFEGTIIANKEIKMWYGSPWLVEVPSYITKILIYGGGGGLDKPFSYILDAKFHTLWFKVNLVRNTGRAVAQHEYSQLIGCLMYTMTCTRPDIAYAVGRLSSYTSNPNNMHWHAVKRVLRYLRHTMDCGLCFNGEPRY